MLKKTRFFFPRSRHMFLLILNDCSQHLNMSDSEEEFFLATQMPQSGNSRPDGAKVKEKVVSDGSLSVVDYFFIVTFNWDLMVGDPFKMTVLEAYLCLFSANQSLLLFCLISFKNVKVDALIWDI